MLASFTLHVLLDALTAPEVDAVVCGQCTSALSKSLELDIAF